MATQPPTSDKPDTAPSTTTPAPGSAPASAASTAPSTIQPGEPGNEDGDEPRAVIGDPNAPLTPIGDTELTKHIDGGSLPPAEGRVTHRVGGTLQREATPEELPADAKVAPLAEQVAPNSAPIAVGARPQPEEIAGVPQPEEGNKQMRTGEDAADSTNLLGEHSDQHDDASRADEDAARDADRGRL